MRVHALTVLACCAAAAFAGCGDETRAAPPSGTAYRALGAGERLAVATGCRDRAAEAARGDAADDLREIDPAALREQLDGTFALKGEQRRAVADVCTERVPFVTPGLRVSFDGAPDAGDTFTYQTNSDVPLRIRGAVTPAPRGGTVEARREFGRSRSYRGPIAADGRFELPAIPLRKQANNGFIVTFHAPPRAPRQVYFSAICLDCLAGGTPPASD